jgi:hypothetical protein
MNLFISSFKNLLKERIILLIPFLVLFVITMHYLVPKSDEFRVLENNSFWKKKTFDKNTYDIVVCGDSRVYRGVSPNKMKEVLSGFSIVNFGYGSAGYDEIMFREINKRINAKRVGIVVLGLTPSTLTHKGSFNYHLNNELGTKPEELIELMYFKKVFQYFIPVTLKQLDRSIKGKKFTVSKHQEYIDGGWVATHEDYPQPESALKSYNTYFIGNQVENKNIEILVKQIRSWGNSNIQVFVFRPPTTSKMVSLEDSLSGFDEQLIKKKLETAGAKWLEFEVDKYFSFDGSHLQKGSAIEFSKDLALKIRREIEHSDVQISK